MRGKWTVIGVSVIAGFCGVFVGLYTIWKKPLYISPISLESIPTPDPILSSVAGVQTIDAFPPTAYFPSDLTPTYSDDLSVTATSYAVMDRDTRELLFAKDMTDEHPIASLTKIMTTIIALETYALDTKLTVSGNAAVTGEAFMGLTKGEILTVEDLLYGVMLPSGNDASETLAQGLSPDEGVDSADIATRRRNQFITRMNTKAKELGMYDTYFYNPTGLDERLQSLSTFSTALDLLALSNYALTNTTFAKIAQTEEHIIPYEEGKHKAFYLYNILQFDRTYKGIKGIKPGNTEYAGETLASYIEHDGRKIIVILLGSTATRDDALKIYRFLFEGENAAKKAKT